jgi:amidase
MAHTVADAAAMLDAISGYVTGDAFWAPPPARPFADEVGVDPGRLRVVFTTKGAGGVGVAPGNVAAVEATAVALEELGHAVDEVDDWPGRGLFPDNRVLPLHVVYGVQFAAHIAEGRMPPETELEPTSSVLVDLGRQASAVDLFRAGELAARTSREVVAFFDDVDVFLTPVIASQPSRVGEAAANPARALEMIDSIQFTAQYSVSGQPAVSVPAGLDDDGLPVGVQLVGRPADEATLLRVAAQLEQARPWSGRHPPGC